MFDYRISKHPHFNEACRAFAIRHNMAKLAERAGMNVQTLRNKLNPEQHHNDTAGADCRGGHAPTHTAGWQFRGDV